jgi:hypothetical protein
MGASITSACAATSAAASAEICRRVGRGWLGLRRARFAGSGLRRVGRHLAASGKRQNRQIKNGEPELYHCLLRVDKTAWNEPVP